MYKMAASTSGYRRHIVGTTTSVSAAKIDALLLEKRSNNGPSSISVHVVHGLILTTGTPAFSIHVHKYMDETGITYYMHASWLCISIPIVCTAIF